MSAVEIRKQLVMRFDPFAATRRKLTELCEGDWIKLYDCWFEISRLVRFEDSILVELDPSGIPQLMYLDANIYLELEYVSMKRDDLIAAWTLDRILKKYRDCVLEFLYHPSRNMAKKLVDMAAKTAQEAQHFS